MKNRNLKHSDNWETPKEFYDFLDEKYHFDFDPCPLYSDFDGLKIEWGKRNFINPPYSIKLKEAFILKAVEEMKKGKLCVMLLPVSTSTKIFHETIFPNASDVFFIRRRLKFIGINTKGEYVNWHLTKRKAPQNAIHVKNSGMHDSMIVVFNRH